MKTELTQAEQELMIQVRDEWINHALTRNGQIDEEAFEEGINWLYTDLLVLEKPKIVYCDSLLSAAIAIYAIRSLKESNFEWVGDLVTLSVGSSVRNSAWGPVRDSVIYSLIYSVSDSVSDLVRGFVERPIYESIKAAVKDIDLGEVGDLVGDLVNSSVFHSVVDSVSNSVSNSVWDSVRASVDESVWNSVIIPIHEAIKNITASKLEDILGENSTYINYGDYGWVAFYDFFTRIGVVNHEKFNKYLKLIKSGVFETFVYKNIVFAVRPPVEFKRNEQGRLHSYDAPAVTNRDGTVHYFIHGVNIKPDIWEKLKADTLTFDDFVQQKNEEIKAAILSYIEEKKGNEGMYRFISEHLKEVDTYVDKKPEKYLVGTTGGMNIGVYTLYKGTFGGLRMAYVRCYCPSSDRLFLLSVHPVNNNAKDAIASLYRIPRKLVNHIKYIQRQGERFSTVFDEDGRKKLTRISKEELSDLVPISGNEYFEKMRYEY